MAWFRTPFLVACLWVLISTGQAYPLAQAYGPLFSQSTCACQEAGRACQHGCLLKQKKHSHSHGSSNLAKTSSHQSSYVAAQCSKRGGVFGLTSWSSELFLPSAWSFFMATRQEENFLLELPPLLAWKAKVASPPPKV